MLIEQMGISAMAGMITALVVTLLIVGWDKGYQIFFMGLFGATVGWLYGMLWIFTTGGLEYTALALVGCIFVMLLCSWVALYYLKGPIEAARRTLLADKQTSTLFSIILLVGLALALMFGSMPVSYTSAPNTLDVSDVSFPHLDGRFVVDSSMVSAMVPLTPTPGSSLISVDDAKSAVNFPVITDSPSSGDYLEFLVTFNVQSGGGDWTKPYVKMVVYQDMDGSGTVTPGDKAWFNADYKIVTTSGNWRSNLLYLAGAPTRQENVAGSLTSPVPLPIYHANAITVWQNDNGRTFLNTPEKYTSPHDQISWRLDGGYIYCEEEVTTFATVNKGSSTTIRGKIYCKPDYVGQNLLWIGAYDLNFETNPYDTTQQPRAQKTMTFTIDGDSDPGPGNLVANAGGPYSAKVNQNIQFQGSASGGTSPYSYGWVFGDGTTGTGATPSKSYSAAGTYTATLTVTDDAGGTASSAAQVTITPINGGPGPGPEIGIDVSSWVVAGVLGFGCIGAIVIGKRFI